MTLRRRGFADLQRHRFYSYGVRIPRWLFVLIYGKPHIKIGDGR
jgi:hypothetical protein